MRRLFSLLLILLLLTCFSRNTEASVSKDSSSNKAPQTSKELISAIAKAFDAKPVSNNQAEEYKGPKGNQSPTNVLGSYIKKRCLKQCANAAELSSATEKASKKYDVPNQVILSIIATESGFRPKVVVGTQMGLMQVDRKWHESKFKGKNQLQIDANVSVGTSILKDCLVKHSNILNRALQCYNGGNPDKSAKSHYVAKVRKTLAEIEKISL
jgi:soluble lytic murein transglycosylase-like protein